MTERELKKLSRGDLLEMLLSLTKENEQLRAQLEQAEEQLAKRTLTIDNAGSLADAALQLSGVFEAAQAACELYSENIRQRSENQEAICLQMEQEAREKCERMLAEAKQQADEYWTETQNKVQTLYDENVWLWDILNEDVPPPQQE